MVYKQDEQLTTRTNGSESRLNGSQYKLAKQVTKLVYDTFTLQLTTTKAHSRHNHTQWSQQPVLHGSMMSLRPCKVW